MSYDERVKTISNAIDFDQRLQSTDEIEQARAAVAASDAILLQEIERALFKVEGIHHIHGIQCLCGFASHRSRSRTEHITGVVRAAIRAAMGLRE